MSHRRQVVSLCIGLALLGGTAAAQDRGERPSPPGADPIGSRLFPPELIMSHQHELGVDDAQRAAILKEIEKAQPALLEAQWQMQGATEALARLLEAPKVDELKALAQADKVMALERAIKRAHLGLLIRIRNLLTDAQRAKLSELRGRGAP